MIPHKLLVRRPTTAEHWNNENPEGMVFFYPHGGLKNLMFQTIIIASLRDCESNLQSSKHLWSGDQLRLRITGFIIGTNIYTGWLLVRRPYVFGRFLATDNFALSLEGCYYYSKFSTKTMKIPKGWYHFTPWGFEKSNVSSYNNSIPSGLSCWCWRPRKNLSGRGTTLK